MSRSSAEAEYHNIADTVCEITWLVSLLAELQISNVIPVSLFCDNQFAINIASNPVFHERIKHIEIEYHLVCHKLKTGLISIHHIVSHNQPTNLFTKDLSSS